MEVLFILLPATLLIAGMFVGLFVFSVNKGQFEELESPANRAIFEDNISRNKHNNDSETSKGNENGSN